MRNEELAARLEEAAELLEREPGANRFRVAAYRDAASTVRHLEEPVTRILERAGERGLRELHGIGEALAGSLAELVRTGRLGLLDELRERADPERLLTTLPGVGPVLAARIHRELGVESLAELETAIREGRLRAVTGVGPTLEAQIRETVEARLRRRSPAPAEPPVAELLSVDREYREAAERGRLRRIAPRRLNPKREAWLPVLETCRGERRYTALYSNTALAHELGKCRDWVVLYHALPGGEEAQATVVTATTGPLAGRRVVRGREQECLEHHREEEALPHAA